MKLKIDESSNYDGNEPKLIGFIMEYPDNSYSLCVTDLTPTDENKISEILYDYIDYGVSVRGDKNISLSDVL
jgi:hypothetical protein